VCGCRVGGVGVWVCGPKGEWTSERDRAEGRASERARVDELVGVWATRGSG